MALLEGDPGLGKSFLALDLCARLSTGRPWPDGAESSSAAACIFLNGEDSAQDTVAPRLLALGADPGRVFVLDRGTDDMGPALVLPDHVAALEAQVVATDARLLVIDPVMQFFGAGVNTSSDQAVRRALAPLADLARRNACTVLLIRHLNKVGRGRALYRGLGSIGLVGCCRSAWLVAEQPEHAGRRVLAQQKNNLGPPQPALAFEIAARQGAAAIHWLGPVDFTADALLAAARPGRRPRDVASAWLVEVLADGPLPVREIADRATAAGLAHMTVRRAREEMGLSSVRVRVNGRQVNYWKLPHQQPPPAVPPEDESTDLEPWLAPLRERFPPPTLLDDD